MKHLSLNLNDCSAIYQMKKIGQLLALSMAHCKLNNDLWISFF